MLAGPLGTISSRAMKIYFSILVILFISGTTFNLKPNPEEIALNFLVDSLINKPIYSFNNTEEQAIFIDPLISKRLYENGFLNGFKLYSEGLAYGFPEEVIPFPMTKKEYKEFGYPKSAVEKSERIIKASYQKRFDPIYTDTITIEVPKSIQLIHLKNDRELIQQDHSIYIRVFRALETEKEFLVQLTLYENFIDLMHHKAGFIMEFIINKNNGSIEWDVAGSYH